MSIKHYHFHDQSMMIGHVIGRIDNLNNYFFSNQSDEEKYEEADFEDIVEEDVKTPSANTPNIPDELNTPEAIEWLTNIQSRGWLDEHFQPVRLTVAQMGCIVVKAQFELNLDAC